MKAYTDEHAAAGIDAELPAIETWPNQFAGYEIEIDVPEFTSICPKSLKMYTIAYRNLGIFQENVVNCFLRDIVKACKPKSVTVTGDFVPRGGLGSRMVARWEKKHSRGR